MVESTMQGLLWKYVPSIMEESDIWKNMQNRLDEIEENLPGPESLSDAVSRQLNL